MIEYKETKRLTVGVGCLTIGSLFMDRTDKTTVFMVGNDAATLEHGIPCMCMKGSSKGTVCRLASNVQVIPLIVVSDAVVQTDWEGLSV